MPSRQINVFVPKENTKKLSWLVARPGPGPLTFSEASFLRFGFLLRLNSRLDIFGVLMTCVEKTVFEARLPSLPSKQFLGGKALRILSVLSKSKNLSMYTILKYIETKI